MDQYNQHIDADINEDIFISNNRDNPQTIEDIYGLFFLNILSGNINDVKKIYRKEFIPNIIRDFKLNEIYNYDIFVFLVEEIGLDKILPFNAHDILCLAIYTKNFDYVKYVFNRYIYL